MRKLPLLVTKGARMRRTLGLIVVATTAFVATTANMATSDSSTVGSGRGPHGNELLLPMGCASCHVGHGVPGAAMLPAVEEEFCFQCHGNRARIQQMQQRGRLALNVFPQDIEAVFEKISRHPIWDRNRHFAGEPVRASNERHAECGDCHDHHRVVPPSATSASPKPSTLSLVSFEYELCYRCHGTATGAIKDVSFEFNAANKSAHPVERPAQGDARTSLKEPWDRAEYIGCTDCHGNSDSLGPAGPHGSDYRPLLRAANETSRGAETSQRYGLCYSCHSSLELYTRSQFAEHGRHVQTANIPCSDCHNAHGSPQNRALIDLSGGKGSWLRPSRNGRLEFISQTPGQGTCSMNCHGYEHDATAY